MSHAWMSHVWRLAQLHGDLGYDLSVLLGGALGDVARGANLAVGEAALGGDVGVVADHAVLDHAALQPQTGHTTG